MPSGKKPTKKKNGAKSVRSVPPSDLTQKEREKKVVFRGQTITYEEQLALEDLEKELGRTITEYRRTEVKQFAYSADNGKVTALEIRGVGLKRVPESIRNLKSLKALTLSYNELTTLPESIGDLKSVGQMFLHGNKLISLPTSIGGLESLRCLWLQENQLTELPDSFFKLQLDELKIENNPLNKTSIKRRMKKEKEGKNGTKQKEAEETKEEKPSTATYQGCDIIITEQKALKDLENLLKEPIPHTPIPQRLYVLNFSQGEINVSRIGFGFRTSDARVIGLGLNGKGLITLPESIADLKGLKFLQLENNQFLTLPEYFGNLELLEFLYLNNNKLTALPESIGNLQFLRILELSDNQLKTLPKTIDNMISLRILNLNNNKLSELPASMRNLTVLNTLSVENNQLTSLPDAFSELKSLYSLNLSNNQLKQLPMWIGEIELVLLKVEKNALTALPTSIGNLQKLQKLELKGNRITTLPDSVCELKTMWMLDLRDNQLEQLPESIGELEALRNLLLENNRLTMLPESISELKDLWDINLDHNQLTTLPESIANLQKLDTLLLRDNQLTRLPENFGNLKWLKTLNLNNNQIMNLPQSLIQLSKLESLSIENNPLTQNSYKILEQLENRGVKIECAEYLKLKVRYKGKAITPEEKVLLEALEKVITQEIPELKIEKEHVRSLSLSGKGLTTVPDSITNLTWLESLDLSSNQLTTLPEAIGNLKALKFLNIDGNKITSLPESIGKLKSLLKLTVENNQLTELPETIGNLTSLEHLDLTCNGLKSLPKSIGNLISLYALALGMNELTTLPESIENLQSKDFHIYLRGNKTLTLPEFLSKSIKSKTTTGNFSVQVKLTDKTLELGGLKDFFTWKNQQAVPSNAEANTLNVEVNTQCAGSWLWIKVRGKIDAKEWRPDTDRASGDDVSFESGHDWIGLIKNVPMSVTRPEILDNWALYTTSHSYTYRDWAVDEVGSYVEEIDEHGKVTVILVVKYFAEKPQSEYTEYIQLKENY